MSDVLDRARAAIDRGAIIEAEAEARAAQPVVEDDSAEAWHRRHQERLAAAREQTKRKSAPPPLVVKVNENALVDEDDRAVTMREMIDFAEAVGEITGPMDKQMKRDRAAQDDALAALRVEVFARLDDMQGQIDQLENDLSDVLSRGGSSGKKIAWLHRRGNGNAAA
ncbi:hypothetical protein [Bradyrhizobium diazoefficiens]